MFLRRLFETNNDCRPLHPQRRKNIRLVPVPAHGRFALNSVPTLEPRLVPALLAPKRENAFGFRQLIQLQSGSDALHSAYTTKIVLHDH